MHKKHNLQQLKLHFAIEIFQVLSTSKAQKLSAETERMLTN
jgi:hypothetical protein